MPENLLPPRSKPRGGALARASILPISRIDLDITDTNAFEKAVRECAVWLMNRVGVALPSSALDGEPFDLSEMAGASPCKSLRIQGSDGLVWAARLDDPDKEVPQRTWRTEIVLRREVGKPVSFQSQLTCVSRGEAERPRASRPGLVRQILQNLSAERDGWPIEDVPARLARRQIDDLESLLFDPERRLPVLAISLDQEGRSLVDPAQLTNAISGAAHVVVLDYERCRDLTKVVGKRLSTYNGAVRLYRPGFAEGSDPYLHRLWLQPLADEPTDTASSISRLVFEESLNGEGRVASFATLQRIAADREAQSRAPADEIDAKELALEQVRRELRQVEDDLDEAFSWNDGLKADLEQSRSENDKLRQQNHELRAKVRAAESRTAAEEKLDPPLTSYDDLEEWANTVLDDHIVLAPKAIRGARRGHPDMLSHIERTLLAVRDYKIPLLLDGTPERKAAWLQKVGELALEDEPCFANPKELKSWPEYQATYDGTAFWLSDHIKYGRSTDLRTAFRIYYAWDREQKRLVIGSLPDHLDNNLTN